MPLVKISMHNAEENGYIEHINDWKQINDKLNDFTFQFHNCDISSAPLSDTDNTPLCLHFFAVEDCKILGKASGYVLRQNEDAYYW